MMVGICGSQSLLSSTGFRITGFRLGRHSSVIYRKAYLKEARLTPPSMWAAATCEVPDLIKGKRRQQNASLSPSLLLHPPWPPDNGKLTPLNLSPNKPFPLLSSVCQVFCHMKKKSNKHNGNYYH